MKTNSIEKKSIADEFSNVPINDQRLINRLIITATRLDEGSEMSIPDACRNWAEASAAYDFFANKKVNPSAILSSHRENTIERLKRYPVALLIQDTTKFDYSNHKSTKGLGPYTKDPHSIGLLMHSVLAVSPTGVPLGLLYQDIWSRENYPDQKRHLRYVLPIEAKESFKWLKALEESLNGIPDSVQTVTVCDREADIFEFFQKVQQLETHLVVRAVHNRRITGEYHLLYDQIQNVPEMGQCLVDIPRKPEQNLPPRQAKLGVRFCPVNICPAHSRSKNPPGILFYVLCAREIDAPEGEEPIEWLLLTTIPVTNMVEALQKIEWYRERWKIERFHYTLKSGCHVEELQLETKERLSNAIALYSVIAWRLAWLTYQARVTPDLSCEIILETHEWQMLHCVVNQTTTLPEQPPTLRETVRLIAKLGGFLGRKHDGEPGVKVLWRGLQKLNEGLRFVEYFRSIPSPSPDTGNE